MHYTCGLTVSRGGGGGGAAGSHRGRPERARRGQHGREGGPARRSCRGPHLGKQAHRYPRGAGRLDPVGGG